VPVTELDVDVLTVIYGPAKPSTWLLLEKDMWKLAKATVKLLKKAGVNFGVAGQNLKVR